jgi:myosin-crossreactive antigen
MTYSRQVIRINTKITNEEQIKTMVQPVLNFTDKHDIEFKLYYNDKNELISDYEAEGKTSAYCKGMVAEVKQMIKDAFKCKLDTIFYAY